MTDDLDMIAELTARLEAGGYDPAVAVPLFLLLGESAILAAQAKIDSDIVGATVGYGRVTALFDALLNLGLPVPGESPDSILEEAEAALAPATDPLPLTEVFFGTDGYNDLTGDEDGNALT